MSNDELKVTEAKMIVKLEDFMSAVEIDDIEEAFKIADELIALVEDRNRQVRKDEDPFDVFICYKETDDNGKRTVDSSIANDIYYQLTQEGFKVFYSAITLEDKLGEEYEPYIFAALNSAKVMLVLGTKPEYFTSVWVKNEWSRFLKLTKSDSSKLLIPCYRDMDAYDLPDEFARLQAQDMSKIGFLQDIIRGVKKVVKTESSSKHTTSTKMSLSFEEDEDDEPMSLKDALAANKTLRRAYMYLEDEDWWNADKYCDKVLDDNPENAYAYLGKCLADFKLTEPKKLLWRKRFKNDNFMKALRFGGNELVSELLVMSFATINKAIETVVEKDFENRSSQYADDLFDLIKIVYGVEGLYDRALELENSNVDPENGLYAILILWRIRDFKDSEAIIYRNQNKRFKATYDKRKRYTVSFGTSTVVKYHGNYKPLLWNYVWTEGKTVFLLSKFSDGTMPFGKDNSWKNSKIREYLNGYYYNDHFVEDEKKLIILNNSETQKTITKEKRGLFGKVTYEDLTITESCQDNIFLLSVEEAEKYFESKHLVFENPWWLRSPSDEQNSAVVVSSVGNIDYDGRHVNYNADIRPALWLDLESIID